MKIIHKIECSEQAKERKQSSMSRNTGNINMIREELNALVINEQERDEFGFQMFQNPFVQAPFQHAQKEYRLKYNLKQAYDNQEFLRKMRADIKREYLTRKKQLKKLQKDAAVRFREDEMKLQEHYSTEFAKSQKSREIDIHAPLVSHVALPHGKSMNVKEFNIEQEFEGLRNLHQEYYESEMQIAIEQAREDEEARAAAEAAEEAARRRREEEMSIEAEEAEEMEPTYDDDDIPVVEPKERHASNSAAVAATTNIISAKKKAASKSNAAAAAKARIAKQQQKKSMKFVPFQVTINDNRERHANNQDQEATAILSTSKLEINLPKKSLQGVSREAIKRHNQKWNRDNAIAKQSGARGTRIANLRDPRPWHNNSSWTGYESD
jgi:ADP-ribose pyrophosphatase YjhB (NUDIX family)